MHDMHTKYTFNLHKEKKKKRTAEKVEEKRHGETKGNSSSSSSDALARERSTSSNWGGMLSFGCPLSISLLPRLTVSPSYDDEAYTSGYLYLILSRRRCHTAVATRHALGSGLLSADRMATSPACHQLPSTRTVLAFQLFLSLSPASLGTSTARPHTRHSRRR